jgi:hypothetical protein
MRDGEIGEPLVLGDAVADVKAGSDAPGLASFRVTAGDLTPTMRPRK